MSKNDSNLLIRNISRAKLPSLAFESMKNEALGKDYSLTLNIVSKKYIHALNKKYRNVDAPTDILSFPVGENDGEIYINTVCTRSEAKKFARKYANFFAYLFIHGLTHLKGYDHSSKMEGIEEVLRAKFKI